MAILDFLKRKNVSAEPKLQWAIAENDDLALQFTPALTCSPDNAAIDDIHFGVQLAYLRALQEEDLCAEHPSGYTITPEVAATLDNDFGTLFQLPEPFPGRFNCVFSGTTSRPDFAVELHLVMPDDTLVRRYTRKGCLLILADNERYRLNTPMLDVLAAIEEHGAQFDAQRTPYQNTLLVYQLQQAKAQGLDIDLGHFRDIKITIPDAIGVAADETPDGGLLLTPTMGPDINVTDIASRLGQIDPASDECLLKVKNSVVLLNRDHIMATEEIRTSRYIPRAQVQEFLATPTAYLNAALVDLDTGFSLRATGAEARRHRYFGVTERTETHWFDTDGLIEPLASANSAIASHETLKQFKASVAEARATGATCATFGNRNFDISNAEQIGTFYAETASRLDAEAEEKQKKQEALQDAKEGADELEGGALLPEEARLVHNAVLSLVDNDEEHAYGAPVDSPHLDTTGIDYPQDNLLRHPFDHQDEGIKWILAHLRASAHADSDYGALLADDMGLGKTYMTLVAIEAWYQQVKTTKKPCLIVAPLSLLENWSAEVDETFKQSPFTDIVILQSEGDLHRFVSNGGGRETTQHIGQEQPAQIRYALKVGAHHGSERLDIPGRLVITTYQTLRDYQFSLSRVDWGVVAFDEGQNLKNPNSMATIAAKALKASFKLLASATPVENSLKDFWSLYDTAMPGLLGSWKEFHKRYVLPIAESNDDDLKQQLGIKLRAAVGDFMLRRTKAQKLKGLPQKHVFTGDPSLEGATHLSWLSGELSGQQLNAYEKVLEDLRALPPSEYKKNLLGSIHHLKLTSIHHGLAANEPFPTSKKELEAHAAKSIKIQMLIRILSEVQKRNEKIIVFATSKIVQAYVAALIRCLWGVPVHVINGETKAVAKNKSVMTRKRLIADFQEREGFGAIVLSTVAAGVGLTITKANNVCHLERHWNPAKEAQATDRAYRIGQVRDVNVYVPITTHPKRVSYDLQHSRVISSKVSLSDAVVAPHIVSDDDMVACF